MSGGLWDRTSRLGPVEAPIRHYSCVSSFAELCVVPETGCIPIPADVPFDIAALVGCAVTTGFGAVTNDARVRPGDHVAVIGIGGVGLNALAAARLAGAATILALDINPEKAQVAMAQGATHFLRSDAPGLRDEVMALTAGRGADSTIECTGRPQVMRLAYEITRPAGRVVIVGIAPLGTEFAIPAIGFPGSKKHIIGSIYGGGVPERDIARVLSLYREGRLDLAAQIGRHLPLEAVNEALAALEAGVLARSIISFG